MDPISGSDRLVALLRQKLEERAKTSAGKRGSIKSPVSSGPQEPSGVHALAAIDGADEHQLRRAFIQYLLVDQLGSGLMNDARFQQVVSRVTEAIEEDGNAAALLNRLVAELRPS
jgi:hypothetical protein